MLLRIIALFFAFASFAAGIMMGATPHDAATYLCGWTPFPASCLEVVPGWFDRWAWLVPTSLFFVALVLFFWAPGAVFLKAWLKRYSLISLHEAAAQIYGELRGTDLGRFTEGHTGTPDEILDNIGMQILHNADVKVRHHPSPNWEIFPKSELSKMGVCEGATGIRYWGQQHVFYTDPKVSRKNVARVTRGLKKNANFISEWRKRPPEQAKEPDEITESYPNLRVADFPRVIELFAGDKLIPLLEAEKITAWGRPMGPGEPPPTKIRGEIWKSHYLVSLPKEDQWQRSQSYLKTKTRHETSYYDVHLNKIQTERVWPGIMNPLPLEIIFDSSNPGRKFWSIEPMRDEKGRPAGSFWEYRALIKNASPKTLRNVKVVVEAIGPMPSRPEPSQFDINKQHRIDLNPQEETLVLIRRWFNPPIVVGMACGTDVYGPIKMTASADDVPPITKLFHFNPEQTPMIFE